MKSPTLGLRTDQFDYVELILLAVAVGVLAALGNLGFRELIEFFTWLFRHLEWNAARDRSRWIVPRAHADRAADRRRR